MIEQEAKEKWCPHSRVTDSEGRAAAANRYENEDAPVAEEAEILMPGSFCIGSACMAWRVLCGPTGERLPDGGFCGLSGMAGCV